MKCSDCGERMLCKDTREKDNIRYRRYQCSCGNENFSTETLCDNALDEANVIRHLWKIQLDSRLDNKGLSAKQAGLLQKESERHGIRRS